MGNFDAYETMREFWIKVFNYIISMLVKNHFKEIKFLLLLAWILDPDGATLV